VADRGIRAILEQFPFRGKYKERQEDVLAVYLYEKLGHGGRKPAYEEADISESAASSIDDAYRSLSPRERIRLMRYLAPIYEELSRN
jgi:hypothetical protein